MGSLVQKLATFLIISGALVLVGYSAYNFFPALIRADDVPLIIRLAVTAIAIGFAILMLYVVVDRVRTSRTERFEEVD